MRKFVTEEKVAAAIEHCQRENLTPSRGRIMGLLAQRQFGGCAGDPKNVGKMIKEYLAVHGETVDETGPIGESLTKPLPEHIQARLGQTAEQFTTSLCGLSDDIARDLDGARTELRANYDQAADQLRREANQAVEAAQADEQDALNALEDTSAQKADLEEQLKDIMQEQTKALAVASERGEQVHRLEAELERTRIEAAADKSVLTTERNEARRDAKEAASVVNDRAAEITRLTSSLATATADYNQVMQQLAISQALADDRATRNTQLETLLANALRIAHETENAPEASSYDQGHGDDVSAAAASEAKSEHPRDSRKGSKKPAEGSKDPKESRLGESGVSP